MQLSDYGTFPSSLPVIVEDDIFLYPYMISPIFLSDDENILSAQKALDQNSLVVIIPSKIGFEGGRNFESIFDAGVIGSIMRKVVLPDGRIKILFQGLAKGRVSEIISENPLEALVELIEPKKANILKLEAILSILKEKLSEFSSISGTFPSDLLRTIEENRDPNRISDLVCGSMKLKKDFAYKLFIEENMEKKLLLLIDFLLEEIEAYKIQREIKNKAHIKIEKANKEYFLKEQLKQIQKELGVDAQRDEEIEEYRKKLEAKKDLLSEDAYKEIKKQIDRFSRMHPDSADANLIQGYLDWVLEIPFGVFSKHKLNIKEVQKHLDKDHFSLDKPKQRIVEFFAVKELLEIRKIKEKSSKGAILCFAGPPGVGKTSLANSISNALKRKLIRIALGGLEDVNELRGHRRTYIGAMPGRIAQGLIEAKEMNPVVVLDEIDKVGRNHRGDPTAVLLEILDPEQNDKFRDYFLNFNIDLSQVVFIATANEVGAIPSPLRDRMEFIFLSSYTPQEKFEIAKKYLIPQELKKHGLKNNELSINSDALKIVIENYTREAGVRNLRRRIADIVRKGAKQILEDESIKKVAITQKNVKEYLERTVFEYEEKEKDDQIGVVNGLAWTSVGGDVLKVEAVKIKGKGGMQITGSLGEVMKESSKIAHTVVKILIDQKKIKIDYEKIPLGQKEKEETEEIDLSEIYRRYDLHLHVPEGATPKDGPSAGITMATAIASILSDAKVRSDVAMTGELTLSGKVLPIGGLKEKLIAAYKSKVKTVLIPRKNYQKDLEDIPDEVKNSLEIIAVDRIEEVLKIALLDCEK